MLGKVFRMAAKRPSGMDRLLEPAVVRDGLSLKVIIYIALSQWMHFIKTHVPVFHVFHFIADFLLTEKNEASGHAVLSYAPGDSLYSKLGSIYFIEKTWFFRLSRSLENILWFTGERIIANGLLERLKISNYLRGNAWRFLAKVIVTITVLQGLSQILCMCLF